MFFTALYFLFALFLYIVSLPTVLLLSLKQKYKNSLPARFFLYRNPKFSNSKDRDIVWFHACSLGEVNGITPIISKLDLDRVNISTITETGFNRAKEFTDSVRFLPFEIFLPFWIQKVKTLVVFEAELWLMLFFIAKRKGAKTILLNARVSDKSNPKYRKFKFLYQRVFKNIDIVFAQSEIDKRRLLYLGAERVEVIGNIKLAQNISITKELKRESEVKIITAGSTHKGEEELILSSFFEFREPNSKLILVPRHPERFDEVEKLIYNFILDKSLTYHRFSNREELDSDIILIDKLGELVNLYSISDIAIIGGTFNKSVGGHNPVEPAYFNLKIISGESYFNQKSLYVIVDGINFTDRENLAETLARVDLKHSKLKESIDLDRVLSEIES